MEIIIFIISAGILFAAFCLLNTMPRKKTHIKETRTYEDYFMEISSRIQSIKSYSYISAAENAKELFVKKFSNYPDIKADKDQLELQIESKKRLLGTGLWF